MCGSCKSLGDARDEIVTWDYDSMYIYTQDDEQRRMCMSHISILIIMHLITGVNIHIKKYSGNTELLIDRSESCHE